MEDMEKVYKDMTVEDYLFGAKLPGGVFPSYDLKIYGANGEDYIKVMLFTDDEDGKETKKTISFIQTLLENGIRFSLEPEEGGVWWKSEWNSFNEFLDFKTKQKESSGDDK